MTKPYSPKAFLKQRRPENFSDTEIVQTPILDRTLLEYTLETLTNRSEEVPFENFARELAKHEICPNILTHTGPSGGGDSKVDAETYPVADALSLVWHVGTPREAANERWAFAFSAKKDWRTKVQSDIAKLAATNRDYTKAFFITNQFVKDKTRAEVEDDLRGKHKLDVRIFDRNWILDRVFTNHHELLAIKQLGISLTLHEEIKKGPRDTERASELTKLEEAITTATQSGHFTLQFVDDCISTAQLARNMERPRTEVEGLLARAERVAGEYGTTHQQLVVAYERATTAYWYFEDHDTFIKTYPIVEALACDSVNVYDLELLSNLWLLLRSEIAEGIFDAQIVAFETKTTTLNSELERLAKEGSRPSAALQARTMLLYHRLFDSSTEEQDTLLEELRKLILNGQNLAGYPLKPHVQIIKELGATIIGERAAYEHLFKTVIEVVTKHDGDIAAARLLCMRGNQHLLADRPYDAIRILGSALNRLYKYEGREDLIRALYVCGVAYEQVGLLWAARGTTLTAAALATEKFYTYSRITKLQADAYCRMKWLELQLGRLPQTLTWHELDLFTKAALNILPQELDEEDINFNAIFGILFLRADIRQLRQLTALPDLLDDMRLPLASGALLFALGHDPEIPNNFGKPTEFFQDWFNQPIAKSIPQRPELYLDATATLTSKIAGCQFSVETLTSTPAIDIAESILAAIESLLSTTMTEKFIAREPILTIRITIAENSDKLLAFEVSDHNGRPHIEVCCANFSPHTMPLDDQKKIKAIISDLLVHVFTRVFFVKKLEETLTKLFRDEQAIDRAINFTSSLVVVGNILGEKPKTLLTSWKGEKEYALKRISVWSDGIEKESDPEKFIKAKTQLDENKLDTGLEGLEQLKHTDIEMESLIRPSLWDQARWNGTAFEITQSPPTLALTFNDREAAIEIFRGLKKDLGDIDSKKRLRISILRGVSKEDPLAYTIIVGSNISVDNLSLGKRLIMGSRVHTMHPTSQDNLLQFLKAYERIGAYCFMPALRRNGQVELIQNHSIVKQELHIREAWQLGRHDPDSIGIIYQDPIIPPEHEHDAPVLEVLHFLREKEASRA